MTSPLTYVGDSLVPMPADGKGPGRIVPYVGVLASPDIDYVHVMFLGRPRDAFVLFWAQPSLYFSVGF